MAEIAAAYDRFGGQPVSSAKVVEQRPPFWWVTRAFVGVAIIAVIMLGWVNMRQGLIDQGIAQGKQLAQAELSQLRADTKRLRADFNAEIARKKELATLYERAEAARKQAVADHKTLADKLKAYEAKKPASAKHQ